MYEVIRDYKSYLEKDCRFTRDTVVSYMGNLPEIFRDLKIRTLNDINAKTISYAWRIGRWEPIQKGIQISETAQNGYLLALKEFLRYLEEKGYNVEQGISEIIRLEEIPNIPLKGLSKEEQRKLADFLLFNISNDLQRKETALISLIWATGCRLNEALALNVGNDGLLSTRRTSGVAGDFEIDSEKVSVSIRGVSRNGIKSLLPRECVNFLNFHLENRSFKSPILFLNNARTRKPGRLSGDVASNLIERVFRRAGIEVRNYQAVNILRSTASTQELERSQPANTILQFPTPAKNATAPALNHKPAKDNWSFSVNQQVA